MKVFKYTNIGSREVNQDYIISHSFSDNLSLHLVADGMGGLPCGEIASEIVGKSFLEGIGNGMTLEDVTSLASCKIVSERNNIGIAKMGSTVAGVLLDNMDAKIFWAGDSRVYVFRNNSVIYQTEDHSMVNELAKTRNLSFDERKKYSNIVTRSIMGDNDCVDTSMIPLLTGDEILICTDGLYKECSVEYIAESIRTNHFDIDKHNDRFEDNHSLIYIAI